MIAFFTWTNNNNNSKKETVLRDYENISHLNEIWIKWPRTDPDCQPPRYTKKCQWTTLNRRKYSWQRLSVLRPWRMWPPEYFGPKAFHTHPRSRKKSVFSVCKYIAMQSLLKTYIYFFLCNSLSLSLCSFGEFVRYLLCTALICFARLAYKSQRATAIRR